MPCHLHCLSYAYTVDTFISLAATSSSVAHRVGLQNVPPPLAVSVCSRGLKSQVCVFECMNTQMVAGSANLRLFYYCSCQPSGLSDHTGHFITTLKNVMTATVF